MFFHLNRLWFGFLSNDGSLIPTQKPHFKQKDMTPMAQMCYSPDLYWLTPLDDPVLVNHFRQASTNSSNTFVAGSPAMPRLPLSFR